MRDQKNHPGREPDLRPTHDACDPLAFDELEDVRGELEELEKWMEEADLLRMQYEEYLASGKKEIPFDANGFCIKDRQLWFYGGPGGVVRVPEGVTEIMPFAFETCEGLTGVELPETLREIGEAAFGAQAALEDITIPRGVEIIRSGAFAECAALRRLSLPETLREIGFRAFSGCRGLEALSLPDSLAVIEAFAFESCSGLTEVRIPDHVREIDVSAFADCDHLRRVSLPAHVRLDAFDFCAAEIVYRSPAPEKGDAT